VRGKVMSKNISSQEITLRHGDVPGFMVAMTMDYSLPNASVLEELHPGDQIAAQIVVDPADAGQTLSGRYAKSPLLHKTIREMTVRLL
jgi:Cu/Ag efflux protein CusF